MLLNVFVLLSLVLSAALISPANDVVAFGSFLIVLVAISQHPQEDYSSGSGSGSGEGRRSKTFPSIISPSLRTIYDA